MPRRIFLFSLFFSLLLTSLELHAVQPGDQSLNVKAEQALTAGDTKLAIELFIKWLEAVPSDHVAWYNYACALALDDQTDEALQAFDDAVTAGWRDSDWPLKDKDFETIRDKDRFPVIIKRMQDLSELERAATVTSGHPFYATQERIAPYMMTLPCNYDEEGKPFPLVILLHGRQGDMDSLEDLDDRLAIPGIIYVMPQAPYTISTGQNGFEYWPRELTVSSDKKSLAVAREYSIKWLGSIIRDVSGRANVDTSRVLLVGFSQGGALTLLSVLESPENFLGGAILGGFIPTYFVEGLEFNPAAGKTSLFVGHGTRDRVIELPRAELIVEKAEAAGIDIVAKFYPCEHEIPDEMVVDLAEWINSLVKEETD